MPTHEPGGHAGDDEWPSPTPSPIDLVRRIAERMPLDPEASRRLEAHLALVAALLAQAPVGLAVFDRGLRYVLVNDALAALNGIPPEAHVGRTLSEVLPDFDVSAIEEILQGVLHSGEPVLDLRLGGRTRARPPGIKGVYSTSFFRLPGSSGEPFGVAALVIDMTERHTLMQEVSEARERLALLNEATNRIGTTLELAQTAREVAEVLVPGFADTATVDVFESVISHDELPDRTPDAPPVVRRIAVRSVLAGREVSAFSAPGEAIRFPTASPFARCLRSGRAEIVTGVDEDLARRITSGPAYVRLARRLDLRSFIVVPFVARGAVLGLSIFGKSGARGEFDEQDLALATEVASHAALSIDNARLYSRERSTALTLQRRMLPQKVSAYPGIDVAYRYLPGGRTAEVGGDWFDVIALSGRRIGLVVGDVMGHGIRAAATMGQLRTAVRTLAGLDLLPHQLLAHMDEMVQGLDDAQLATCVYVVYDPASRRCGVSTAGHPPPVVVRPDGTTELLDLPGGAPLGVGGVPFETREIGLPLHGLLVLYTDGLVESPGADIDRGLAALRRTLAEAGGTLEDRCDAVLTLVDEDARDDIAVLMARVRALPPDQVALWTLPAEPETAAQARRLIRQRLHAWGLEKMVDVTVLLVSELVTNAVRHGLGPVHLRLLRDHALLCEVADQGTRLPRLRFAGADDEAGRGLHLVSRLAHRWGTRPTMSGKVVWFEQQLPVRPPDSELLPASACKGPPATMRYPARITVP